MGDAFEFAEAWRGEREPILDVAGAGAFLGVMGELSPVVFAKDEVVAGETDRLPPGVALFTPPGVPLFGFAGVDEEFEFHLLELAAAEGEVPWRDFVAERLADLRDAEWNLDPAGVDDVVEVGEDSLGGLGSEVGLRTLVANRAAVGLEHQVEHSRLGERALFLRIGAHGDGPFLGREIGERTGIDLLVRDRPLEVLIEFLSRFGRAVVITVDANKDLAAGVTFDAEADQVIGSIARLRFLAIDHGVVKTTHVAGGDPGLGIHNDRAVHAHHFDVRAGRTGGIAVDDVAPPSVLEISLEFDAVGAVVPETVDAAVDLGALEDKASSSAEGDDVLHTLGGGFAHQESGVSAARGGGR